MAKEAFGIKIDAVGGRELVLKDAQYVHVVRTAPDLKGYAGLHHRAFAVLSVSEQELEGPGPVDEKVVELPIEYRAPQRRLEVPGELPRDTHTVVYLEEQTWGPDGPYVSAYVVPLDRP